MTVVRFGHLASELSKAPMPAAGSPDADVRHDNSAASARSAYHDTAAGVRSSRFQTLAASSSTSLSASTSASVYKKPVTSVASHKKRSRAAFSHAQVYRKLESVQLRKHCISKATPTLRQSIWHVISIFYFLLRFGKFRLAITNADLLT